MQTYWENWKNTNELFNGILNEIEDIWLMSDILEIPPINDKTRLFREFKKKYGINKENIHEIQRDVMELIYRVDEVKKRIGDRGKSRFKEVYVISNVSEYLETLKEIRKKENNELWFRGQNDQKFHLIPNVMRYAKEVSTELGAEYKPRTISWLPRGQKVIYPSVVNMLNELKEELEKSIDFTVDNDFEWLFLGQHYGMLTPLLDWSEDPLVALFFALDGLKYSKKYMKEEAIKEYEKFGRISQSAAIYVLEPGKFNKGLGLFYKSEGAKEKLVDFPVKITKDNEYMFRKYIDGGEIAPICIRAMKKEYRMCRQSGNFLCQGTNIQPIDTLAISAEVLYKIYVPYYCIDNINSELQALNITKQSIYGDKTELDEIAKKIRHLEEKKFRKVVEKINEKFENF